MFVSLEVSLIGHSLYMYTMQFNCEKWTNLFHEENLRGWLGIEDYSKRFTSDYILKQAITCSKEWVMWFDFERFNLFLINRSWHVKKNHELLCLYREN